jgi:hypothetical protein
MLGANQTVKFRHDGPYRWSSGMGAMPCVSVTRSPRRAGRVPSNTLMNATVLTPFAGITRSRFHGRRR